MSIHNFQNNLPEPAQPPVTCVDQIQTLLSMPSIRRISVRTRESSVLIKSAAWRHNL